MTFSSHFSLMNSMLKFVPANSFSHPQKWHLSFIPSWGEMMWNLVWLVTAKYFLQIWHSKVLYLSWTFEMTSHFHSFMSCNDMKFLVPFHGKRFLTNMTFKSPLSLMNFWNVWRWIFNFLINIMDDKLSSHMIDC